MTAPAVLAAHNPLALVVGDLNVGHRTLDIKNWKGNVKRAGFLPQERAYFDRFVGAREDGYNAGAGSAGSMSAASGRARCRAPTPGGRTAARPSTPTPAGGSTTTSPQGPRRQGRELHDRPGRGLRSAMVRPRPRRRRLCDLGSSNDQAPAVLGHAALRRIPPRRQLHRRPAAVERAAGDARRGLLRRRPARDHGAAGSGQAAREDPAHGGAVHRGGHRPDELDPVRAVARARAHRARLGAQHHHRFRRGEPHDAVQGQAPKQGRTRPVSGCSPTRSCRPPTSCSTTRPSCRSARTSASTSS